MKIPLPPLPQYSSTEETASSVIHAVGAALSVAGLVLLVILGGVVYTAGMGIYGLRRVPFNHALWHALVLLASVLHFFAVLGSLPTGIGS